MVTPLQSIELTLIFIAMVAGALLIVRLMVRRAQETLGETMKAASAIVAQGLTNADRDRVLGRITAELAHLLEADVCIIALPTGDGRLQAGAAFGLSGGPYDTIADDNGMCGLAYQSGRPIVARNIAKEPLYRGGTPGIISAATVPLRHEGRVLGAFNVESRRRRYTDRDLAVLVPLGDHIAAVIENLRMRQLAELDARVDRKERKEIEAVSSVVMAGVSAVGDLETVLRSMLDEIRTTLGWPSLGVILYGSDGKLHTKASYGYPGVADQVSVEGGEGIVGLVAQTGVARLSPDVTDDPDYRNIISATRSEMCAPLMSPDRTLGVLNAESPDRAAFSDDDFRLLQTLAPQMAIVVERAHLTELQHAALERLRDLDHLKEDFIATVSHELRTPLTSIKGFAQTMLARGSDLTAGDRHSFLEVMVRQCDRLAMIVDRLLLVSRLEAGEIGTRDSFVELAPLLRDAVEGAGGRGRVEIDLEARAELRTDPFRLHHIMRNLIENACKYSPDNAPVLVRARIKKDELEVEVLDRGAGIPLGAETAIFDRFRRLDDAGTSPVPGTGLGLYVARRFARDMGGEVSVDGAHEGPWTGARFVLHLPKRDLPAAA